MKKLILLTLMACSLTLHAQYFQRYFYNNPQRNETFADGICTQMNLTSTAAYYNITWGTAFATVANDTNDAVRFVRTNSNGTTVNTNVAASFKDNTSIVNSWYNATGNGICEISRTGNAGGYIGVGAVSNNSITGATVVGGSDGLFTKISNSGTFSSNFRYDFTGGNDVFTSVIRSKIDTNRFYICGYSEKTGYSDVIVLAVKSNGAKIWSNIYHLSNTNYNVYAKAFGIDEVTVSGKITVVGSYYDPLDGSSSDGFAMMLNSTGSVVWVNRHNIAGFTDVYRNVINTQTPNTIAICGYSNYQASVPYDDVWLTLIDTTGNVISSYKYRHRDAAGNYHPSRGWDLREINTVVYVTGPVYLSTDTVIGLYRIYSASPSAGPHEPTQYRSQKFDKAYGIDRAYKNGNHLIRLFTGIDDVLTPGVSSGYIIGTNYYGNTCSFCFVNAPLSYSAPLTKPNVTATKIAAGAKVTLASAKQQYSNTLICSASAACSPRNQSGEFDETSEPENSDESFSIYPNPITDQFRISFNDKIYPNCKIEIIDITGRIVLTDELAAKDESDFAINTSLIPAGLYLVRIDQNGIITSKRIVKH